MIEVIVDSLIKVKVMRHHAQQILAAKRSQKRSCLQVDQIFVLFTDINVVFSGNVQVIIWVSSVNSSDTLVDFSEYDVRELAQMEAFNDCEFFFLFSNFIELSLLVQRTRYEV